jgi:transcriptional regulator with XRE-family HTH domain
MRLHEWVKTDERSQSEMAEFVGVHYNTFSRWVSGRSIPAKRHARKLRELTGDKVTLADCHRTRKKWTFRKKE